MTAIPDWSTLLGYASMFFWGGAQFPQILKNFHRQSCDGLALPFLANWFLGDFSNLVGCILTHQLPFQTWLASYFVSVDVILVTQYFYYSRRTKPNARTTGTRRMSIERGASRYRTLSAVAANVAATAALAAQQNDQYDQRRKWRGRSVDQLHEDPRRNAFGNAADEDDVDEGTLVALADSFHSERGNESRRNRVSWSVERPERSRSAGLLPGFSHSSIPSALQLTTTEPPPNPADRGRPAQREVGTDIETQVAPNRRGSRASRKGTMVFLSAWVLFGLGTFASNIGGTPNARSEFGKVLAVKNPIPTGTIALHNISPPVYFDTVGDAQPYSSMRPNKPAPGDSFSERVVGRIFAWLCTTLYLTSRLPQIWKNFVRKSVEGLSMFLFVFAFLGNTFYVASILTSPKMQLPAPASTDFIRESIPYLLGSGGTLMFDITIVAQSFIYRPRPRRHSISRTEEEAGLLSSDALANNPRDSSALPRDRTSRNRIPT